MMHIIIICTKFRCSIIDITRYAHYIIMMAERNDMDKVFLLVFAAARDKTNLLTHDDV